MQYLSQTMIRRLGVDRDLRDLPPVKRPMWQGGECRKGISRKYRVNPYFGMCGRLAVVLQGQ